MDTILVKLLLALLFSGVRHGFAQDYSAATQSIQIVFDEQMKGKLQWVGKEKDTSHAVDIAVNESIWVNGLLAKNFKSCQFKNGTERHPEFGAATKVEISGDFKYKEIHLLRETTVWLPKKYPNTAIFQTKYINKGKKVIKIDSVHVRELQLSQTGLFNDSHVAEPLVSFQGGVPAWGEDYAVIPVKEGFYNANFQGMHQTEHDEYIGGGIPLIDVWGNRAGVALCHLSKQPEWLALPVSMNSPDVVNLGIVKALEETLGMKGDLLSNQSYTTVMNAVVFHNLDYYNALHTYAELLRDRGIAIPKKSPQGAHDPYWKSWGFELDFNLAQIYETLPELAEMGVHVANLDDGWFDYYGDWNVNRAPGKFPNGVSDMSVFVNRLHKEGFKTNLWWYPLGVSPESQLAREHAELLIVDADGSYFKDKRQLYQLCPAYPPALNHIEKLVDRFIGDWEYDGLYTDTRGLSAVPPCFNKAHKHQRPLESFEQLPKMYERVNSILKKLKKTGLHEVCICAAPHSPYNMPYYDIANASDPVNTLQTRRRIKVEKALHGPSFAVGDCYQVPDDEWSGFSVPQSFESAVGIGGQATTFYTDLDEEQKATWKRWFGVYNNLELGSAQYTNLYDVAFDKPEGHVVKKGNALYYGFFAPLWSKEDALQLRGLVPGITYKVFDYANNRDLGTVDADRPFLYVGFKEQLLLRASPKP
ncbi:MULTISPECIES: alpha-galactosidase [Flavobacteriaceae]|uniref:alpha-galactosidase n=1 Tax=Flavobacteriaceae TaxID=49546 RepID=UPI0014929F2E|nr:MULTISPECIES: alpha-galactosidase [Allomuricauda]MDC6366822.1 alpha-galactosidase [Muricauda sp. AC10]